MTQIDRLLKNLRPQVQQLKAYESARSLVASQSKKLIYLDANEFSANENLKWNRYPEPQPQKMLDRLGELYEVNDGQILVSRGSDEAIDLIIRALCRADLDSVLYFPPTYGMYKVSTQIQGARCLEIDLLFKNQTWQLDWVKIQKAIKSEKENLKIIFLCQPNNPTGHALKWQDVQRLLQMASDTFIVVDEAYIEFSKTNSCVQFLKKYPNLIILRTLSKAWSLAALRVGAILADPKLIQYLNKIRAPYPVPQPIINEVLQQLKNQNYVKMIDRLKKTLRLKADFAKEMSKLSFVEKVFRSQTNFLLIKFRSSSFVMVESKKAGFVLRDRSQDPGLKNCVRITIGNTLEMKRLITFFKELDSLLKRKVLHEKIPFC